MLPRCIDGNPTGEIPWHTAAIGELRGYGYRFSQWGASWNNQSLTILTLWGLIILTAPDNHISCLASTSRSRRWPEAPLLGVVLTSPVPLNSRDGWPAPMLLFWFLSEIEYLCPAIGVSPKTTWEVSINGGIPNFLVYNGKEWTL